MGNSIYDSATIYKCLLQLKLEKCYRRVILRHIMSILISVFTIGYKGKTVQMGKSSEKHRTTHDIGILAPTDPVALDQACIDLIYAQRDGDGSSLVNRIESRDGLHTLEYGAEIGLGSRTYELVSLDD